MSKRPLKKLATIEKLIMLEKDLRAGACKLFTLYVQMCKTLDAFRKVLRKLAEAASQERK